MSEVRVLGVRHHGPGSARSAERALEAFEPDAVLVEGPPDAEPLLPLAAHPDMRPPVALLGYLPDDPARALFFPFADFSPEWRAFLHALRRGAALRLIDLPVAQMMAEPAAPARREGPPPEADLVRADPLAWLARATGHGDAERLWEDLVEHRGGEDAFEAIAEAMAELRREAGADAGDDPAAAFDLRREAAMRQGIRKALRDGFERVAVVCGAWHAPALATLGPASRDQALLKGAPRKRVATTWVPWTFDRLSERSGYGAGVSSPGWYAHLFHHRGEDVLVRWMARTAQLLREQDLPVSSAHAIEAVRLAETLAAIRERPLAGLAELTDATRAVLGEGADAALALVHDRLVVGEEIGEVPAEAPTVPLQADLERLTRRLRLRPSAGARTLDLDLRRDNDRERSHLLHRLSLLGVPWGERREATGARGTFHEIWDLEWQPEFAVRLIEASRHGTTIAGAAGAVVRERCEGASLEELTRLVEVALLADLPDALEAAMAALAARAAVAGDALSLMGALPALARVARYGDVRRVDTSRVEAVVDGVVARVVVGLPLAAASLDDDAAAALVDRIEGADAAIGLLEREHLTRSWRDALARLATSDVHGRVAGRASRLLHDAGALPEGELGRRASLALSRGEDPARAAAWLEGLLAGSGLLLLHDDVLLAAIDRWLEGVSPEVFTDLVPVLRRTFSQFPPPERRRIGQAVARMGAGGGAPDGPADDLDHERAAQVLPVLRLVLTGEGSA